jgi:hypothetical protein
MLRSAEWLLVTDVSGQPVGPTAGPLKMEPIDFPEMSIDTKLRCVTSQKSIDVILRFPSLS